MCRRYRSAIKVCEKREQGAIHFAIIAAHRLENLLIIALIKLGPVRSHAGISIGADQPSPQTCG